MSVLAIDKWPTNGHLIADVAALGYLRDDDVILDPTYGLGTFWTVWQPGYLIGTDIDPAKSLVGESIDFTGMPTLSSSTRRTSSTAHPPTSTPATGSPPRPAGRTAWRSSGPAPASAPRVCKRTLIVKCQDQVVSSKIRWQTKAVADEVEPLGFGLRARFDFLSRRAQPSGRRQINPHSCSSQLLVFERGWEWSDLDDRSTP